MKINKNTTILVVLLLVLLMLSSCKPTMHEEPTIKISNNSNEFKVIHYLDRNNKKQEDIEDTIKRVMVGQRFIDLPVVDFDEKIIIEPLNFETTEFEVYNYIVNEDGNIISDYNVEPITIATFEESKAEFIFEEPLNLEEYRDNKVEGKSIHCLLLRSEIHNSSFAFGILVLGAKEESIAIGDYIMEKSEEVAKPTVQLKEDNKFIFNYSVLSSYIAIGSYDVDDDSNLILKTDDGKFQYVFKIKGKTLIFNLEESAEMPSYVNIPDGSIFKWFNDALLVLCVTG